MPAKYLVLPSIENCSPSALAKDPLPVGRGLGEADDEDGKGVDFDADETEIDLLMPVVTDAVMDTEGAAVGVGVLDTVGAVDSAP